jgi:hypothetical protein
MENPATKKNAHTAKAWTVGLAPLFSPTVQFTNKHHISFGKLIFFRRLDEEYKRLLFEERGIKYNARLKSVR